MLVCRSCTCSFYQGILCTCLFDVYVTSIQHHKNYYIKMVYCLFVIFVSKVLLVFLQDKSLLEMSMEWRYCHVKLLWKCLENQLRYGHLKKLSGTAFSYFLALTARTKMQRCQQTKSKQMHSAQRSFLSHINMKTKHICFNLSHFFPILFVGISKMCAPKWVSPLPSPPQF